MKNENIPARWVIEDGLLGQQDHIDRLTEDLDNPERHWCAVGIEDEEGYAESVAYCHPFNAPLIAAAPDLLESLAELCEQWPEKLPDTFRHKMTVEKARAAIAKATARPD